MSDDQKYPSNSLLPRTSLDRAAEEKRKAVEEEPKPSIQGKVQIKKKTVGQKLVDTFFAGDIRSVINHIVYDIGVTKLKEFVVKSVSDMFGNPSVGRGSEERDRHTDYTSFSRRRAVDETLPVSYRTLGNDVIFETEHDARQVLEDMRESIRVKGYVTVRTFYGMARLPSDPQHTQYGWRNLDNVPIYRSTEGYSLGLPRAEYLGR